MGKTVASALAAAALIQAAPIQAQKADRFEAGDGGAEKAPGSGDVQAGVPSESNPDEIVVTGTREQGYRATVAPQVNKSDTPLKEVPFSVQVVTRELIRDRGITSVGEALRYVPGFSPQVGFGAANDRYRIRGFGVPYTLKNGLRRNAFTPIEQLVNIEQIEVLKGPASALYGRFEPGGVVNLVTKKPFGRAAAEVVATAGDFDLVSITSDINLPLSDSAGLRVNLLADDKGSYRDFGYSRGWFVAPVLVAELGADTKLTVEGEYGSRRAFFDRGFGNNAIFFRAPRDRQFAERDANLINKGGLATALLDHRFSDSWSARLAFNYSDVEQRSFYYAFGFPPILGATGPNPLVNRRPQRQSDDERALTTQLEIYGRFNTGAIEHKLLAGLEFGYDRWRFDVFQAPSQPISFFNPVYGTRPGAFTQTVDGFNDNQARALYVQDEIAVGPFRVVGGLRYDRTTSDIFDRIAGPNPGVSRTESGWSPRVGVTITPRPEVSFYASWSRGFRPQTDVGRLASGDLPDALRANAIEGGAKLSLLGGRLNPTLAIFAIERKNAATADPNNFLVVQQVGESRTRGVEIDIPAAITRRWRLIASYTHLDTEITRDTVLAPGLQLINAPRHSASLWTSYDLPGPFQGVSIGTGVQHVGRRAATNANTLFLPAYTRVDANLSYLVPTSFGTVRAQLNALNITNKFYYDSPGSFVPIYPGAPRTITGSIGLSF